MRKRTKIYEGTVYGGGFDGLVVSSNSPTIILTDTCGQYEYVWDGAAWIPGPRGPSLNAVARALGPGPSRKPRKRR